MKIFLIGALILSIIFAHILGYTLRSKRDKRFEVSGANKALMEKVKKTPLPEKWKLQLDDDADF